MRIPLPTRRIGLDVAPSFWLLVLFYAASPGSALVDLATWAAALLVSLLVHELGHALTALFFGIESDIELHGMGGHTKLRAGDRLVLWKRSLVTLNGCVAGAALAVLCWRAMGVPFLAIRFYPLLESMVWINGIWSVFNLLPIPPMDGGRLLGYSMESWLGAAGEKVTRLTGIVFGALVILVFVVCKMYLSAALTAFLVLQGAKQRKLTPQDKDPKQMERLVEIQTVGAAHRGRALLEMSRFRRKAGKGVLYELATEQMAIWLYLEKRLESAQRLLKEVDYRTTEPNIALAQTLACQGRDWERSIELGMRAFMDKPQAAVAFNLACGYAKTEEPAQALRWLKIAVNYGVPGTSKALKDPDFDAIRGLEAFQELEWLALALEKKGPPGGGPHTPNG